MRRESFAILALVAGVLWLNPKGALADNPDRFYMSGQAALQAGAITADSADGASTWYNPAGLARVKGARFDVNLSAYALRLGGTPDLVESQSDTTRTSLSVLDFAPVPAGLAFTGRAGRVRIGFGMFVPKMEVTGLRTRVVQPTTAAHPSLDLSIDVHQTTQSLYAGPGFGLTLAPGVDFGASIFVNYRSLLATADVSLASGTDPADTFVFSSHELIDWVEFGVLASMGVQLRLSERLRLGMNMRLPSVRVFQIKDESRIETDAAPGATFHDADYAETVNVPPRLLSPPRLDAGLSYQWTRSRLALETSYHAPLRNPEIEEDSRPFVNGRVGYRHTLANGRVVGGGLFTNLSSERKPTVLGERQVNFYGLTIATQSKSRLSFTSEDRDAPVRKGHLIFGSTFALSYALGIGKVVHGNVGFGGDSGSFVTEVSDNVIAHEWIVSVGSSLMQ